MIICYNLFVWMCSTLPLLCICYLSWAEQNLAELWCCNIIEMMAEHRDCSGRSDYIVIKQTFTNYDIVGRSYIISLL